MQYINPADYGVFEDCRLVLKNDVTDEIVLLEDISNGEKISIEELYSFDNIYDYKFLFQVKINSGYKNLTSYNYFYDPSLIKSFFFNKIQVSNDEAYEILSVYWKSNHRINIIKPLMTKTLEFIWKNKNQRLGNLKQMIRLSEDHQEEISLLWKNIISFIKNLVKLYSTLSRLELLKNKDYLNFDSHSQNDFRTFLNDEIERLEESNLQLDKYIQANYYSLLNNRKEASRLFNEIMNNYNQLDVVQKLNIESNGLTTYKDILNSNLEYNRDKSFKSFRFYSKTLPSNVDISIVFSMDRKFINAYGIQLLYSASILKDVHFHFHIIDEDGLGLVNECETMFNSIINFREISSSIKPTFSYERIPKNVVNPETYYACARFIHADYFLDKFNNDILIFDADFYIVDVLDNLLKKCKKHDIATSVSSLALSIFPWRRFMAGMVYLSNSNYSREYTRIVTGYILSQINEEVTWTLDQNALTYGYEKIKSKYPDINFGNLAIKHPPIMHPRFRGVIERG